MDIVTIPAYHTANSYTTFADADSYISSYSRASYNWGLLSKSKKKYALILAAQALNSFNYRGWPVTKNQTLAFPRYASNQLHKQLDNFYDIDYTSIVTDGDFEIEDNKIVSTGSLALFADAFDNEDLVLNQVIRVSGITADEYEYLTVIDMDSNGEWVKVKEALSNNSDNTLSIWAMNIFGVPKNVEYAQIEMAAQVVNTKMFMQDIGERPEPPIQSFSLTGALSVRYITEITRRSKFEDAGPLDIIYNLLNPWLAGIKGAVV